MTIRCPHCQTELDCDSSCVGVEINCPACNNLFIVPRPIAIVVPKQQSVQTLGKNKVIRRTSFSGYPSWKSYILGFIISILLIPLYGIGLFFLILLIFSRYSTKYTITNNVLTVRKGIILKNERSIFLKNIQKVDIHRDFGDLITNCATVVVETMGRDSSIVLPHLSNAKEVQKRLYNMQ